MPEEQRARAEGACIFGARAAHARAAPLRAPAQRSPCRTPAATFPGLEKLTLTFTGTPDCQNGLEREDTSVPTAPPPGPDRGQRAEARRWGPEGCSPVCQSRTHLELAGHAAPGPRTHTGLAGHAAPGPMRGGATPRPSATWSADLVARLWNGLGLPGLSRDPHTGLPGGQEPSGSPELTLP